ncbi:processive 1,2-diacylglycerol beta-glucosyltransferase [Paenibacillus sp. BK033]|uniref:MGDG synthase family glycosyltransferase n=1 Tax=Paenibacillus sp. BK033 TaxID=2512133 RepID=UPI001052EFE5|nr:glycosyltransferase [Paenibacillus sp. BK033]TCM99413.1 processive 1,2-diacylglycerol beta-glucosyltransferase [Paenibacillus sp. BK033]
MKPNSKIMIIYASFGDGHIKAARALLESFTALGYNNIQLIDLLELTHPRINSASRWLYLKSSSYAPKGYGWFYTLTNSTKQSRVSNHIYHSFGKKKMLEEWNSEKPELIIHTFPYLTADELKFQSGQGVPTLTVITDYVLHSRWLHENTSHYCVGSDTIKAQMLAAGVPEHKISVTGIPVHSKFFDKEDKAAICDIWGFEPDRSRVLLMAGAYGVQRSLKLMISTVREVTTSDLIVVCGKNKKLRKRLEREYYNEKRIHVIGYTDKVHELMTISDCLISKAGGITLTEALVKNLPTIVFQPIPGQEEGNAQFLSGLGVLGIANDKYSLTRELYSALNLNRNRNMKQASASVCFKQSSMRIVEEALKLTGLVEKGSEWTVNERKAAQIHA